MKLPINLNKFSSFIPSSFSQKLNFIELTMPISYSLQYIIQLQRAIGSKSNLTLTNYIFFFQEIAHFHEAFCCLTLSLGDQSAIFDFFKVIPISFAWTCWYTIHIFYLTLPFRNQIAWLIHQFLCLNIHLTHLSCSDILQVIQKYLEDKVSRKIRITQISLLSSSSNEAK